MKQAAVFQPARRHLLGTTRFPARGPPCFNCFSAWSGASIERQVQRRRKGAEAPANGPRRWGLRAISGLRTIDTRSRAARQQADTALVLTRARNETGKDAGREN